MSQSQFAQIELVPSLRINDYDDIAPWYDVVMGVDFINASFPVIAQFVSTLVPAAGLRLRHVDLACGTGALLCAFEREFDSDSLGIDISSGQLRVAREKATALGLRASFHQASVLTAKFPERCDIFTMGCDALNHITSRSGWARLFRKVHRSLVQNGVFIFDVNSPRRLLNDLNYPEVIMKQTATYLHCGLAPRTESDLVRRRMFMQVFASGNGAFSKHEALIEQVALPKNSIREMAKTAGFSTAQVLRPTKSMVEGHIFMKNRWFFVLQK